MNLVLIGRDCTNNRKFDTYYPILFALKRQGVLYSLAIRYNAILI